MGQTCPKVELDISKSTRGVRGDAGGGGVVLGERACVTPENVEDMVQLFDLILQSSLILPQ